MTLALAIVLAPFVLSPILRAWARYLDRHDR